MYMDKCELLSNVARYPDYLKNWVYFAVQLNTIIIQTNFQIKKIGYEQKTVFKNHGPYIYWIIDF